MIVFKRTNIFCLLLCLFVIVFDQATKFSVLAFLPRNVSINIFPGLNLVLAFNVGTGFGILLPHTIMQYCMIIAMTVLCLIFLIYMFFKLQTLSEKVLFACIIGGAIGNLCDRFWHGAIVDFIDIYYKNWHWPAFNIADSFISVSVCLLIIINIFMRPRCAK